MPAADGEASQDELAAGLLSEGGDPRLLDLLERACAATQMGFAALARVTSTRWVACQVADRIAFGLKAGDELAIKQTVCDQIRQTGEAVIFGDAEADPVWRDHPIPVLYGFRSYASLPVYVGGRNFFGTFCVLDDGARAIGDRETVAMLHRFAEEAGALLTERMQGPR